jgi:hypothetical protein
VIFGPGNIEEHLNRLIKHKKIKNSEEYWQHVDKIVEKLKGKELVLLPDRGLPFEIAKRAKKQGNKIIYVIPKNDKEWGIKHIEKNIEDFPPDEIIDCETWRNQHFVMGILGEEILYLGHTSGTFYEIGNAYYIYKLITGKKKGAEIDPLKIHSETRAHLTKKFITYVYKPFLVEDFPIDFKEIVKDMNGEIKEL